MLRYRAFFLVLFLSFFGIVHSSSADLLDSVTKEDMVKEYVRGKAYSRIPGVTQARLGKKAKGYTIVALYAGTWIYFATYACPNAYKYVDNANKANDVSGEMEDIWYDFQEGTIDHSQYDAEYHRLFLEYEAYREKAVSNMGKMVKGASITAVSLIALHLFDHFDRKKEFNSFFEKHKARFNFTLDDNKNIITAAQFSF